MYFIIRWGVRYRILPEAKCYPEVIVKRPIKEGNVMVTAFLISWLLTLALEIPVLILLLRSRVSVRDILVAGLIATTLTIPWLWFVLPFWLHGVEHHVVGELAVTLVETIIFVHLLKQRWLRCLCVSVAANGFSYGMGLLLVSYV